MTGSFLVPLNNQSRQPASISEADVTYDTLLAALQGVFIDAELDEDGDLVVTEGLEQPIWIRVKPDARALQLYSYIEVAPENGRRLAAIADRCNATYCYAQFNTSKSEDRVHAYAHYFYDEMLLLKQFVRLMRYFASSVAEARSTDFVEPRIVEGTSKVINLY